MTGFWKQAALGAAMTASVLAVASPAAARDRDYHRRGNNDAAVAIGAGVVGLALGAALASNNRDRYYDSDYYYYDRGYYYPRARGYYYQDRYPNRHRYDRNGYRWRDGDRRRDRGYYRGW